MRKLTITFSILLAGLLVQAAAGDSIIISGKIDEACHIPFVRLQAYIPGIPQVDTLPVNQAGQFEIKVPDRGPWQYIMAAATIHYSFLVNPVQPVNHFTITCDESGLMLTGDNSQEHEAFAQMMDMYSQLIDQSVKTVMMQVSQDSCWLLLNQLFIAHNGSIKAIKSAYPSTYAARVLSDILLLPETAPDSNFLKNFEHSLISKQVWNDTSFYHMELAISQHGLLSILEARVNDDERAKLMWAKLALQPSNPEAKKSFQLALFEFLLYQGKEKLLRVFCDWAKQHPDEINNLFLRDQLQRLGRVVYGKLFLNINYNDLTGKPHKLSSVVAKQQYTMLVFWSPNCTHCKSTMPDIVKFYNKFHSRGLEIYSIAGDAEVAEWQSYCKYNVPDWVNVLEPERAMPSAFADYMVSNMPAYVLIDKNGIIQTRYGSLEDIEQLLQSKLK
jgi:thiol-disulfide isomerase/thioredoxin